MKGRDAEGRSSKRSPALRGIVVGLTGGIATGKSTAAHMFSELGAFVISADDVARRVVEPGQSALEKIRQTFGDGVLLPDGTLDRRALGVLVFDDEEARRRLEAITHPAIRRMMRNQIEDAAARGYTVVAEIPLLFESEEARALVDTTVVVFADEETQRMRLMARNDLTESEARARMTAQMPLAQKIARADYVINNNKSERELRQQVETVWHRLHEEQEMT